MGYAEHEVLRMNKLYVMSANTPVAEVCGNELRIINDALIPLYLKRTGNFEKWVSDRSIDAVRPNSRVLKKIHGLSRMASDYDTAMKYNAACITDNFWVRKDSETWEDVRFDNDIYFKAAVSSDNDAYNSEPSKTPELTNIGSREKGWRLIEGKWWLYKNEPLERAGFELLTCRIGNLLGFDMALYEMDGNLIRTKDVTEGKYNLQHIDAVVYDHDGIVDEDLSYNYETLYSIAPELARQYMDIKYLDALVNNVDRHTKNYALLTSQKDGHIIKLAPNYDNDMAFYGHPDILKKDRNRGEIVEFRKLAGEAGYIPPEIDWSELMKVLQGFADAEAIADYILRGEKLVIGANMIV